MAKTARYERQEIVQRATHLFWSKGFHATSMRNLQDFIDMRPGSIYASFGSKEGLFRETLRCYADASLARLSACAEAAPSPLAALRHFVQLVVVDDQESAPSDLCMLVKTIAELTEDNAELIADARLLLKEIENAFMQLLVQAQNDGELDANRDPRRLARFLQMQLMGLRTYARANDNDNAIHEMIDELFFCLQQPAEEKESPLQKR